MVDFIFSGRVFLVDAYFYFPVYNKMPKRIVLKIDNEIKIDNTHLVPAVNSRLCNLDLADIVPQSTVTLKEVFCKLDVSTEGTNNDYKYDYINVYISGIVGKNYIIDCDQGFTFLQIPLTKDKIFNGAGATNIQWTQYTTDETFTMSGPLQPQVEFGVLDKYYQPFDATKLKNIMLVFEYSDPLSDRPAVSYNQGVQSFSRDVRGNMF